MQVNKFISLLFTLVMVASLVLTGVVPLTAQDQGQEQDRGLDYYKEKAAKVQEKKDQRITHEDRQAAADRAAEAGFVPMDVGDVQLQAPGDAPHYFSHPNYANSPLRLPDAIVAFIGGGGTGAAADAVVDLATGAITNIVVSNGGSGYTSAPTVEISSPIAGLGSGALATALIGGAVDSLTLDNGGDGYVEPVTVDLVGGGGTGASATATVSPIGFVSAITLTNGGANYTTAAVTLAGDGTGATADAIVTPIGFVRSITVTAGGSGYITPTVVITGDGTGATAEATVDLTGTITAINVTNGGAGYTFATVTLGGGGTGATAIAAVDTTTGPVTAIVLTNGGAGYTIAPTVTITGDGAGATAVAAVDTTSGPITGLTLVSGGAGYSSAPAVVFTGAGGTGSGAAATASISTSVISVTVDAGGSGYATGGMEKFVDPLPWAPGGDPMPLASAQVLSDGSDYYEIGLVQYRQQMHRDLPATLLRGYVQLTDCATPGAVPLSNANLDPALPDEPTGFCGVAAPSYAGPAIVAQADTAVRILFRNLLPAGAGGNLFIPTDTSVMGSGMGPDLHGMPEVDPQNPTCDASPGPKPQGCFTENRANLHLHGGLTPWISDGTPHQWITPAGETLPYPDAELLADPNAPDHENAMENKGVSVEYVPDMWFDAAGNSIGACFGQTTCAEPGATNNPGRGAQTYYYTNQQSARLLFYHDHAWGITRLNVYSGQAAPYIIQDTTEQALLAPGGALEGLGVGIPLVIQDKTFVPDAAQLAAQDNTWDYSIWGGMGNLWLPHVYSPAQNPGDPSGVNQYGRWAYGPWFWPPTNNIAYGPIANPYYDPNCIPTDTQWCEPPLMPGTPFNSMGMEAFHDTPLVNGKAYPTVTLDPGEYRFRILNAASDRFFNLSLYQADPTNPKEVALNAAEVAAALDDPTIFPTPDTAISPAGPAWVVLASEGGFLPSPVVVPAQVTTWVNDPTVFNAGNVDLHSLLLGPAERADVVIDLTPFAGKTLILYNDAPAAFPARDPRYDYYTGNADLWDTGGAHPTSAGYGPNTRTVMQIVVTGAGGTATPDWVNPTRLANIEAAFAHHADGSGVFESSQHPTIVGQQEYNAAYGTTFNAMDGLVQIFNTSFTFKTLSGNTLTMGLSPKMIQDEQGEAFDRDYGRMSGFLGLESPNPQAGQQNMILYPFVNPASELIDGTSLPLADVTVTPITVADDGTQIWKVTHNGVDTHPIHFHLFDVQVINRVGWDGIIRKPHATELGWKDTVRISPLEDTIVALRPVVPVTPFDSVIPNSTRPLNPAMPTGSSIGFTNIDAFNNPTDPIVNVWTNFGWEYVWHCHILSHEEMDMMRPISLALPPIAPSNLVGTLGGAVGDRHVDLTWTDNSSTETGFIVQRSTSPTGPWTDLATVPADQTTYTDLIGADLLPYYYQVAAVDVVGYNATAGYSTLTPSSVSNVAEVLEPPVPPPSAPINLRVTSVTATSVGLSWRDTAVDETGFVIERADNGGPFAVLATVGPSASSGFAVNYTDATVAGGNSYEYRVAAENAGGLSAYTNVVNAVIPLGGVPAAPSNFTGTVVGQPGSRRVRMTWTDNSTNETGFAIQRATDAAFTLNVVTVNRLPDTTAYTTPILPPGDYYFRIRARNADGASAWVNLAQFPITVP